MKIRRLELFGFKSFKDKTIISFDQPITAIVGSNGCGKSNVVDALYWVMGDMSPKHLRGHSMADVIFSGSRDTAPMDMAEVTLVLERDPAVDPELPPQFQSSTEIQITRRYYRSGDSEYLLNRVPCRLRDIQEFFMDTGVGAKAYSIIEQGAIARLVTQKPEDRRMVIEEVAGIMKFKARKAESERKLENSRINLQRIDDIFKDLQKQLGSLKRQAEKAEKFRTFSDELRQVEIQMGSKEWMQRSEIRQQSLLLSAELSQIRNEKDEGLTNARALLEAISAEVTELENDLETKRLQSRTAELAVKDAGTKIATLETKREGMAERLLSDQGSLEQLETRKLALEAELAVLDTELATAEGQLTQFEEQLEVAAQELEAIKAKSETIRETLETTRRQLHTEELEQTRLTQQIQNFQRSLAQLSGREDSMRSNLQSIAENLSLHQTERQSTLNHLETAFSTRTDLEQEKGAVDERLNTLEHERTELQAQRDSVRENLTVARIRKEQLEALDRDLDGVDAAGKALAKHLRSTGISETLLADSIRVPSLLEKAVEAVFGRNLQRVVAHNFADLRDFRNVLATSEDADARTGRASVWMPELTKGRFSDADYDLNSVYLAPEALGMHASETPGPDGLIEMPTTEVVKAPTVKEYLLAHPNVVGPLVGLIKDEAHTEEPAWANLVHDVWVVRDRDTLEDVAPKLAGLPLSFVTLNGDVLTKEGYLDLAPLEAGAGTESVGLVQRKREISELQLQERSLEEKLLFAQERFDACIHAIGQEKDRFRELTARLAALNPDVEKHSVLLRQVEAQLARLSEKQTLLQEDLSRTIQEKADITGKIDEINQLLQEAEARKVATAESLESVKAELQTALALQREAESKFQQLGQEARRCEQRLSELQTRRAAAEQERTLSSARREHLESGIANIESEIASLAAQLETQAAERELLQTAFEEAQVLERSASETLDVRKARLTETQRNVDTLSTELQSVLDRIRDIDQELAVNDVEARNLKERIQEQYQIAFDELDEAKIRELASPADLEILADAEAAKKHAQNLRTKIENLGKINMVAVEEFESVSKRHEYLFIQRQDLSDAINQLQDAIERIDRESRHRFAEAFAACNEAFRTTFPILFGGGQAELRLTNPDNMLESGVEIVAQPPGKKLQSVTLLSGGEKALTAVSLIFGIFSIKPSPFCVLDEVDAPLDDANVARFNNQVRRMAETSQIIMITHHKKSMESCDGLFGVTMERPGISKIASAKLGDIKDLRG
ncbi:MAG: AAA family ATPase [Bdellovibrionales bacterium]|nr:AAA family ATPase [Bdellovibrionales bacterium]